MLRRWELGSALRRLREERQMTIADVTVAMKERFGSSFSTTKLSRMETAKRGVIPRDVHDLCTLYGVSSEEREHLMELAKSAREQDDWYADTDPRGYRRYVALEQIAVKAFEYTMLYMHRVNLRLRRQQLLTGASPLQLHVVVDENAIRRPLPQPGVMAGQLRHLIAESTKPNIRVQIMPLEVGLYPGSESVHWTVLEFPEGDQYPPRTAYAEAVLGGRLIERDADVTRLASAFGVLTRMALNPAESRELMRRVLTDH